MASKIESNLSRLAFFILPEDLLSNNHNFSTNPVGSGPFLFLEKYPNLKVERRHDSQIIELVKIKDPTVRVLKLINGEIDLLQNDLPLEMIRLLETKGKITTLKEYGANVSYIGFNFNNPILKQYKL